MHTIKHTVLRRLQSCDRVLDVFNVAVIIYGYRFRDVLRHPIQNCSYV